jgi:hypothetical protein
VNLTVNCFEFYRYILYGTNTNYDFRYQVGKIQAMTNLYWEIKEGTGNGYINDNNYFYKAQ